jgi:DNA-directed RNA polymerase sigma subunit (sigma70/sigma32)
MTLEDIARYKKLTKDKVRNIETKAWNKLKASPNKEIMKKFIPYNIEEEYR